MTFPHILGREFAGEVAGNAGDFKEGDRVWVTCRIPCRKCELCLAGRDNLCLKEGYFGLDIPGGYAEYVAVPIANLNALPSHVRFEDAAAAQIAFGTAWHVLINRGGLQAGQTVLIQAAGSGIGSAAVQVAKLAGAAMIIATASSEKKLEQAKALGATHLINYSREKFADKVMEHHRRTRRRRGHGAHRRRGLHREPASAWRAAPSSSRWARTRAKWCSSTSSRSSAASCASPGRRTPRCSSCARSWAWSPTASSSPCIHKALPLAQAAEAHRVVDSRDFFGKVVLLP